MTEIEKETGMTDAECEYWDDYFTKNPPKVDPSKNGGFAKKSLGMIALDRLSEDYLLTKSIATHKTPTELVSEMVRERIAASV